MLRILNGEWVRLIIDNFDPYGIKQQMDIELNHKYNEELELKYKENENGILGKD